MANRTKRSGKQTKGRKTKRAGASKQRQGRKTKRSTASKGRGTQRSKKAGKGSEYNLHMKKTLSQ